MSIEIGAPELTLLATAMGMRRGREPSYFRWLRASKERDG